MDDCKQNLHEISILEELKSVDFSGFVKLIDKGQYLGGHNRVKYFVVLEKLGLSLRNFYEEIRLSL